ncbi:MAG TPA: hypothetical protein VMT99_03325 [Candidatus Paceibacterota bacterium]|nr:hypothetical protein [Candidatus Paceibacterota bacterium]
MVAKKVSAKRRVARPKSKRPNSVAATRAARRAALLRAIREARAIRERRERLEAPPIESLKRHEENPILQPHPHNFWEMKATFNPGAVFADNRVHLLYRAIGGDDVSVLGYASSEDGITITERLDEPVYVPPTLTENKHTMERGTASPVAYLSGGGWNGGCEDPRLTMIEDRIYLTYTAFDGWGSIRMALSSISVNDFLRKQWRWKKAALISPPGEIHKNWMLFPEKINGRFAILHSISPEILIDYFDTLEELEAGERYITSTRKMIPKSGRWDSIVRGAGPPPIRTRIGWLLFYHAIDAREPGRYKLGVMVLDENDPTKVLYRSQQPILEPDADYENNGFKAGIVYSCGAVVKDGMLYVYYGGSDSVTCVAMVNLDRFLNDLTKHAVPKLTAEPIVRRRKP